MVLAFSVLDIFKAGITWWDLEGGGKKEKKKNSQKKTQEKTGKYWQNDLLQIINK